MNPTNFSLRDMLAILLCRKWLLLLSGLLFACGAFAVSRVIPVYYASEGNLILESHASASGEDPASSSIAKDVSTQIDVLRSGGLIRSSVGAFTMADLVPSMRLPAPLMDYLATFQSTFAGVWQMISGSPPHNDDPSDRVVRYVQSRLQVQARDNSNVISVKFAAGAPDVSSAVVNAIMTRYIATINSAREADIAKTDRWISEQIAANAREVSAAEQRINQFMQDHRNLSEVQGSLTAAMQLSKDQAQLTLAQEEQARQQAAFDTVSQGGAAGAQETLASRSIQNLKEIEGRLVGQISSMGPYDPRRRSLQDQINGVRSQINSESKLVINSIARNLEIANAHVHALEKAIQRETQITQNATMAGQTLKQLTSDLEAKRQLYVAFLTRSSQVRLASMQGPSARILYQAEPPRRPVYSFGAISLLLGFFCGIVAASGAIILRFTLSPRINSSDDVTTVTGLPVFGSLPDFKEYPTQTGPLVTETFRAMWLLMGPSQHAGKVILVTSSETGEGKTTVATALARRYAQDGFRVLLVDGDLRRPQLARKQKMIPKNYFEAVLSGSARFEDAVICDTETGLELLLADGTLNNPVKVLSSERCKTLLTTLQQTYDFVILDSPPVLHVADPILLAGLSQYIIFIVRVGALSRELISEATRRFAEPDREKMFTLLTRVRTDQLSKRDNYSGYALREPGR